MPERLLRGQDYPRHPSPIKIKKIGAEQQPAGRCELRSKSADKPASSAG